MGQTGISLPGRGIDLSVDVEEADSRKPRTKLRRWTDANAEFAANCPANPSAHLPTIGPETPASYDLAVGLGIALQHRGDQITKTARLAGERSGRQRKTPRLLDRIHPGKNRGANCAQFPAHPGTPPRTNEPAYDFAES